MLVPKVLERVEHKCGVQSYDELFQLSAGTACVHVYASWKHMVILLTTAKLFQTFFLYSLSLFFQDFDKLAWHA